MLGFARRWLMGVCDENAEFFCGHVCAIRFAQLTIPECGIEGKPDKNATCGDPVNLSSGSSYHFSTDVSVDLRNERFELKHYYAPPNAASHNLVKTIIGKDWPVGAPPAPFDAAVNNFNDPFGSWVGIYPVNAGVASLELTRPSHDAFSFVHPANQLFDDAGVGVPVALVYFGEVDWSAFARTAGVGLKPAHGATNLGTPHRFERLSNGYKVLRENGEQFIYKKLTGTTIDNGSVLLSEVRSADGQLKYFVTYPADTALCPFRASELNLRNGSTLLFAYSSGTCLLSSICYRAPGAGASSLVSVYEYLSAGKLIRAGHPVLPESYGYTTSLTELVPGFNADCVVQPTISSKATACSLQKTSMPALKIGKAIGGTFRNDYLEFAMNALCCLSGRGKNEFCLWLASSYLPGFGDEPWVFVLS
jgi:hypothetical protein